MLGSSCLHWNSGEDFVSQNLILKGKGRKRNALASQEIAKLDIMDLISWHSLMFFNLVD